MSQCPIAKSNSFLYSFDAIDQAGTFWYVILYSAMSLFLHLSRYHSHLSTQYCDGLRGPIVIYDPADPHASLYDVDDGRSRRLHHSFHKLNYLSLQIAQ